MKRSCVEWTLEDVGMLRAVECSLETLTPNLKWLAEAYNESYNSKMMGNSPNNSESTVLDFYEEGWRQGHRHFLLFVGNKLVGDADFRNQRESCAEFAIMIGSRELQGKSLGTRFGIMLHYLGFAHLKLEKICASILRYNVASLKLFSKLGYVADISWCTKFGLAVEAEDEYFSLDYQRFIRLYASESAQVNVDVQSF